jgi:uncharacterized membrane protein YeaQ/YmgE (transglycosylase-associated protein family)
MHILWTLLIGLLVGALAKFITPGRDPKGCIVTMLLGVAGAFVATWLGHLLGFYETGEKAGFIGAVVGAILILVIYRLVMPSRH